MQTSYKFKVLEEILKLASDDWVSFEDVVQRTKVSRSKAISILDFLLDFKFIKFDPYRGGSRPIMLD